ncbi:MAG: DEAD/DEAH box helicase [Lentisphaerae bacterium]|nr:DEAD/DEAH box helicase [Lentisphaerota bacterium]
MNGETEIFELWLTPHGIVAARPYHAAQRWASGIAARFAEHEAAGLVALAAANVPHHVDASVLYWCDIAAAFVRSLCHVPEAEPFTQSSIEPPSVGVLAEWVLNAPPMQGAEYISPDVLSKVWQRLVDWSVDQADDCGGLTAFLGAYAPQWSRVGRVTLHLAENRGDAEYPFAFMATFAAGLTRSGKVSRLPLGRALRDYAGAGKKAELLRLLSPLHAAAKRSELVADLLDTGDVFHPLAWTPAEAHAFLKEIPLYEECGLLAQLPNWWRKRARPSVSVTLDSKKGGVLGKDALLDFRLSLALGGEELSAAETEALLSGTQGLVLLRGEWVEVDSEKLNEALAHWQHIEQQVGNDGISFIEGMRLLAGASTDLKADAALDEHVSWSHVEAGDTLRDALAGLRTPTGLGGPVPLAFRGELRDYQLAGLNWLWLCAQLGVGSCLADDMGLGKTIQVLAALLRHKQQGSAKLSGPSLLVVPASLIGNWKAEAARFAPDLALVVAHSSETSKQALTGLATAPAEQLQGVDLVITTYSMVSRLEWLTSRRWAWVILDEAQAIKNPSTRQTRAVKTLGGNARVALTGTPVENRLGDLWSIFDFLNPGLLGSATRFKSFAKRLEKREHARYAPLRNLIAPYILRRMKTDPEIVPDLPNKTEMQVFCGLAKPQAVLYKQCVTALIKAFEETASDGIQRRGLVLSYLMRFKQICNHPSQLTGDGVYDPAASAKFERLGTLCSEIASRGEKALIFTQFREITDPLAEFLTTVFGREGLVLHGGTAVKKRKQLVADFQHEDGPPFFVLSIKAGGTGLNLTAASHVIHFDRWWNPAVENQATDRAFRIGQQCNVLVHKFVTRGTIEEKIDALIRAKQDMADSLLEGGAEKALTEMSDEEILRMVSLDIERAGV